MKCKECQSCRKGWFKSRPDGYVCIGVKVPFLIHDINEQCTQYPELNTGKQSKYPECGLLYQDYWLATNIDGFMAQEDFDDWLNEYCYQCKYMSDICMYGEE